MDEHDERREEALREMQAKSCAWWSLGFAMIVLTAVAFVVLVRFYSCGTVP